MVILMPKISVIIPTYNRSGVVKEAISGVPAQTEPLQGGNE
jgi:glycosyltransferase involved in cell wall biosynthesis